VRSRSSGCRSPATTSPTSAPSMPG
jgi:hypothetical protein